MKTLTLTDSQYDDLLHCINWGIDAADTDMGDPERDEVNIFEELKANIESQTAVQITVYRGVLTEKETV